MKKSVYFIFLIILALSLNAQKDSIKVKRFRGFYVNLYYPFQISSSFHEYGKYSDDTGYETDLAPFIFQTPGIGLGYVLNLHPFFIKTDFNYWYGSKPVGYTYGFKAENEDGSNGIYNFASSPAMDVGTRYYSFKDHVYGKLNLHNFDISMAVGCNLSPSARIFAGWRANFLIDYSFNATMDRTVSYYQVVAHTSPYTSRDSLIETHNVQYKNNEIKSRTNQVIIETSVFSFGVGANYFIKKQLFLAEAAFERNIIFTAGYNGPLHMFFNVKVGYVFKYSTYFGTKKTKD